MPGYENPMILKRIFELSPTEKKGVTKPGAHTPYSIFGCVSRTIKDFFKSYSQTFLNNVRAKEILSEVKLFRKKVKVNRPNN